MKVLSVALACALATPALLIAHADKDKEKRPTLSVKANPAIAFSPARVVVTADVRGGPDDFEEYYCADIEWEWGDGTKSDQSADCDPYVAGKAEIRRHFTADRVFQSAGDYRVAFRLKRKDKVLAVASTIVKIRPGLRDGGGY
jgi:hypothetical protein